MKVKVGVEKPKEGETTIVVAPQPPPSFTQYTTVEVPAQESINHSASTCWYVLGILSTIFCCLPCGVIGMVHAMIAKHEGERGNYADHRRRLHQAKCWTSWSIGLGSLLVVLLAAWLIMAGMRMRTIRQQKAVWAEDWEGLDDKGYTDKGEYNYSKGVEEPDSHNHAETDHDGERETEELDGNNGPDNDELEDHDDPEEHWGTEGHGPHGEHSPHGEHGEHGPHGGHGSHGGRGPRGGHGPHGGRGPHGERGPHGGSGRRPGGGH